VVNCLVILTFASVCFLNVALYCECKISSCIFLRFMC